MKISSIEATDTFKDLQAAEDAIVPHALCIAAECAGFPTCFLISSNAFNGFLHGDKKFRCCCTLCWLA